MAIGRLLFPSTLEGIYFTDNKIAERLPNVSECPFIKNFKSDEHCMIGAFTLNGKHAVMIVNCSVERSTKIEYDFVKSDGSIAERTLCYSVEESCFLPFMNDRSITGKTHYYSTEENCYLPLMDDSVSEAIKALPKCGKWLTPGNGIVIVADDEII